QFIAEPLYLGRSCTARPAQLPIDVTFTSSHHQIRPFDPHFETPKTSLVLRRRSVTKTVLATQICQDIPNRHEQVRARSPAEDLTTAGRGNFFEDSASGIRRRGANLDPHVRKKSGPWGRQVTNDLLGLIPDRIDQPPTLLGLSHYFLADFIDSLFNVSNIPAGARVYPIGKHDDGDPVVITLNLIEGVLEGFEEEGVRVTDAVAGARDCGRHGLEMRLSFKLVDDVFGLFLFDPAGKLAHIGSKRDDAYLIVLAQA